MNPLSVAPVARPSAHMTRRITNIVQSMIDFYFRKLIRIEPEGWCSRTHSSAVWARARLDRIRWRNGKEKKRKKPTQFVTSIGEKTRRLT
jgi:hypothetical protein